MSQPGMKNCKSCGAAIDAKAVMCPKCARCRGKKITC